MIDKYFNGEIPVYKGKVTEFDQSLSALAQETVIQYEEAMENMEFSVALSTIWQLVSRTNKYIDETAPWVLAKSEETNEQLASVMGHLAESLRYIGILLKPFLTKSPGKIFEQLGINESLTNWESLQSFGIIPEGTQTKKADPIFPRLDVKEEVEYIKTMMQPALATEEKQEENKPEEVPVFDEITFEDFMKIDLRVAQVTHCEPVKKADKLLKLQLDLGYEKRQVVSGIAKFYTPEELVGKRVICVTNLKPVKLRGELSEGMILAGEKDGILSLASVNESLPLGAKVK
jgi:methionyl-tRNA synthetase